MRSFLRSTVAAAIVGINVILLIVFINITGWLEASPSGPTPTPWPTPTPIRTAVPTPTPRTVTIYVVKPGEVLATIASRFGLSVQDLVEANDISDPNAIRAGQTITIPMPPAR